MEPKDMEFPALLRQLQVNKAQDRRRRRRLQVTRSIQVLPRVLGVQHWWQSAVLVWKLARRQGGHKIGDKKLWDSKVFQGRLVSHFGREKEATTSMVFLVWFRLLMGPERSGSTVHVDPLGTSAWNTSLVGHKRWVLFKEDLPKSIVKGKKFRGRDYEDESINYFT